MATIIDIVIDPKTGTAEFEVSGMPGSKCTDLTNVLAKGNEVQEEKLTDDFYQPELAPATLNEE